MDDKTDTNLIHENSWKFIENLEIIEAIDKNSSSKKLKVRISRAMELKMLS